MASPVFTSGPWTIKRLRASGVLAPIVEALITTEAETKAMSAPHAANGGRNSVFYHRGVERGRLGAGDFGWKPVDLDNVAALRSPDGTAVILFASGAGTGTGGMVISREHGAAFARYFTPAQGDMFCREYETHPTVFVLMWEIAPDGSMARLELLRAAPKQSNARRPNKWEEGYILLGRVVPKTVPPPSAAPAAFAPPAVANVQPDVKPRSTSTAMKPMSPPATADVRPRVAPKTKTASQRRAAKEVKRRDS